MGNDLRKVFMGALVFVIGIILLVAIVLPQMHTGYAYVNTTMTEMTGGSQIWGILELLAVIGMLGSGLGLIGFGILGAARSGGGSRKRAA